MSDTQPLRNEDSNSDEGIIEGYVQSIFDGSLTSRVHYIVLQRVNLYLSGELPTSNYIFMLLGFGFEAPNKCEYNS